MQRLLQSGHTPSKLSYHLGCLFSDPPRPEGQNPSTNNRLRMRNKLNSKTAIKCQRTSPNQRAFISHLDAPTQQAVACYLFELPVPRPSKFQPMTPARMTY